MIEVMHVSVALAPGLWNCGFYPSPAITNPPAVYKAILFVDKVRSVWIKDVRRM
jgi:hypothetical protein